MKKLLLTSLVSSLLIGCGGGGGGSESTAPETTPKPEIISESVITVEPETISEQETTESVTITVPVPTGKPETTPKPETIESVTITVPETTGEPVVIPETIGTDFEPVVITMPEVTSPENIIIPVKEKPLITVVDEIGEIIENFEHPENQIVNYYKINNEDTIKLCSMDHVYCSYMPSNKNFSFEYAIDTGRDQHFSLNFHLDLDSGSDNVLFTTVKLHDDSYEDIENFNFHNFYGVKGDYDQFTGSNSEPKKQTATWVTTEKSKVDIHGTSYFTNLIFHTLSMDSLYKLEKIEFTARADKGNAFHEVTHTHLVADKEFFKNAYDVLKAVHGKAELDK